MTYTPSRVVRSKKTAREHYSDFSRWYDILAGSSEDKFRIQGLQTLDLKQGESILEIGIGTGKGLVEIAGSVGPEGCVVGVDLADGMVEAAHQRVMDHDLTDQISLGITDGAELPFAVDHFDAVFICFTLELFDTPDIIHVLDECTRVLKRGGRILVVSLKKTDKPKLPERMYEWVHTKMPVMVDCRPIKSDLHLVQAGFNIISAETFMMWGLPVEIVLADKKDKKG